MIFSDVSKTYSVITQNTACMMHMGEMTKSFVGIGKEAQADIKPEDAKHATNIANLLGIDCDWMINYFCSKLRDISSRHSTDILHPCRAQAEGWCRVGQQGFQLFPGEQLCSRHCEGHLRENLQDCCGEM